MDDLIRRTDVMSALSHAHFKNWKNGATVIANIPGVQAGERPRGTPISFGHKGPDGVMQVDGFSCPFCGATGVRRFCPDCGAQMETEDKE